MPFQMPPSFTLSTGATKLAARSLAQLAPAASNEVAPGDAATEAQAPESPPPSDTTGITAASATDPITLSQPEIEFLQALAARREQLAERERVFDKMGKRILLRVAARMKEAKLARILAQMDPAKVNLVSAELVRRHELPRPPGPVSGS